MKKITLARVESFLIIAVLITTVILSSSGGYARYKTSTGPSSDTARVAKWGMEVSLTASGSAVPMAVDDTDGSLGVIANVTEFLAPGTNTGSSISFSVKGQPETAYSVQYLMTIDDDIVVPAGTYNDWTTVNDTTDNFTTLDDYHPVVFTLVRTKDNGTDVNNQLFVGTLEGLKTTLDGLTENLAPNVAIDDAYTITWEWPNNDANDKVDTVIGSNSSGFSSDPGVVTSLRYNLIVSATQVN